MLHHDGFDAGVGELGAEVLGECGGGRRVGFALLRKGEVAGGPDVCRGAERLRKRGIGRGVGGEQGFHLAHGEGFSGDDAEVLKRFAKGAAVGADGAVEIHAGKKIRRAAPAELREEQPREEGRAIHLLECGLERG